MTIINKIRDAVVESLRGGEDLTFPTRDNADWSLPETPFKELPKAKPETLRALGCRVFDKTDRGELWLFPGEWYNYLPPGLPITDIMGRDEFFEPGKTDDDTRMGLLAYGFIREPG